MTIYLALLGDPAKIELYDDEFYNLLKHDESNIAFHLLGASEDDVSKQQYQEMYSKFEENLKNVEFKPISGLSKVKSTSFKSRIGLFPSSTSHLISGPDFVFAPFPLNSSSNFLKFKSRFLSFILRPFLSPLIRPLAYFPLGGKAAKKTKADVEFSIEEIAQRFYQSRQNSWFSWFYLEAGSGQSKLSPSEIQEVLKAQAQALEMDNSRSSINGPPKIVPNTIYGGGIISDSIVEEILLPKEGKYIPNIIVVGNISEQNLSVTYDILDKVSEINNEYYGCSVK